jgi:hypothetical protein
MYKPRNYNNYSSVDVKIVMIPSNKRSMCLLNILIPDDATEQVWFNVME